MTKIDKNEDIKRSVQNIVAVVEGDCIACGAICPPSIYCCTDPAPLTRQEAEEINKKGGYNRLCLQRSP